MSPRSTDEESKRKSHPSFGGVGHRNPTEDELVDIYQKAYNDANDIIHKGAAGARLSWLKRIRARRPKPF